MTDWYERRDELEPGQVFRTLDGSIVKLDYRTPGDGSKWTVIDWYSCWAHYDSTLEPHDLAVRLPDDWNGEASAKAEAR